MNMLRASLLVLVLSAASLPVIAPASTPESDYTVTASTQTFVLTRGTPLYDAWKAFIDQQNVGRRKLGPVKGPGLPYEVGRITITISSGTAQPAMLPGPPYDPPNMGPPMPLPANGIEGQTLTMTSQTTTIYQQWVYVFEGRGGGWRELSYNGRACRRPTEGGDLCGP
jgi:hypothetical protein